MSNQSSFANLVSSLDSSLKSRILASGAFKIGGRAIGVVEKLIRLDTAEQKFGKRAIDPSTGEPLANALRVDLESLLAAHGAIIDAAPEIAQFAGLEALVMSRETPYVKVLTKEQLELRTNISKLPADTVLKEMYDKAAKRAAMFSQRAMQVLGELETAQAFAPTWELCDIDSDTWDIVESIETAIARYKAGVATGSIFDDADMYLYTQDMLRIEPALSKQGQQQ
jgi:hypothetical protein